MMTETDLRLVRVAAHVEALQIALISIVEAFGTEPALRPSMERALDRLDASVIERPMPALSAHVAMLLSGEFHEALAAIAQELRLKLNP